eukprot:Em0012g770a
MALLRWKVAAASLAAGAAAYGSWSYLTESKRQHVFEAATVLKERSREKPKLPTRDEQLASLQSGHEYDVLVIGGGITGCGVALDSISRGFSTALVEKDDFSCGTSSRSTKLIHGGVRYLQKAVFNLDYEQYRMVREALHERGNLLNIAPHLSHPLPIMLPVYNDQFAPVILIAHLNQLGCGAHLNQLGCGAGLTTTPYGIGQTTPYGIGQTTPPYGIGQTTPYGIGQTTPYGIGQTTPYGIGQTTPYGIGQTTPYGIGQTTHPYGIGQTTPLYGIGQTTHPYGIGQTTPLYGIGQTTHPYGIGQTTLWWQIPYYWAGIKFYDLVAGKQLVKRSYFVSKSKALEEFPMLKAEKLCGALVYYDGQHNDSRMNIAVALTAARLGANLLNHTEVVSLIKEKVPTEDGKEKEVVRGVRVRELFTKKEWDIRAKVVVNATGAFTDVIRKMDNPTKPKICQLSAGIHIVLPSYYSPRSMGMLDPETTDGRVIFFLPWEDTAAELSDHPQPKEEDVRFILKEIKNYLSPDISVRRGDVLAAWSGIRPLVMDPNAKDTQSIARNHVIEVSDSNLVTIAGGKWTTYRSMACDTVDRAVKVAGLKDTKGCQTNGLLLEGAQNWYPTLFIRLIQDHGLDVEVAMHLSESYGDNATEIAKMAALTGRRWPVVGRRLSPEFPYIEEEVKYAIKEYACTAVDVMARRTRLAFLNVQAADEALPKIVEIMGNELKWTKAQRQAQMDDARQYLEGMGYKVRKELQEAPINLSYQEAMKYTRVFKGLDSDKDGHISIQDLRKALNEMGEAVSDDELRALIAEVDINKNCTIEEEEFLQVNFGHVDGYSVCTVYHEVAQVGIMLPCGGSGGHHVIMWWLKWASCDHVVAQLMSALNTGEVANSRFGSLVQQREKISVQRSGGGL